MIRLADSFGVLFRSKKVPQPLSFELFRNKPALAALAGLCACITMQASSISLSETASADVFGLAGQTLTSTNADSLTAVSGGITGNGQYADSVVSVTDAGTYGALSGSVSWAHGGSGYPDFYSNGNVTSSWSDTVTLQPGTYEMTMIFDSTPTWSYGLQCDNGGGGGSAQEGAQFYAPGIYGGGYGIGGSNASPCNYYNQNPIAAGSSPLDQTITGSFTVTQVTTTLLGGNLSLTVGIPEEAGTGSVSSSGSVQFFLDGVTSGATYASASGTDYETPSGTPEPASFALTGCALILAGAVRRYTGSRPTYRCPGKL